MEPRLPLGTAYLQVPLFHRSPFLRDQPHGRPLEKSRLGMSFPQVYHQPELSCRTRPGHNPSPRGSHLSRQSRSYYIDSGISRDPAAVSPTKMLLPRVFPILLAGNLPVDFTLVFEPTGLMASLRGWRDENESRIDGLSQTVNDLLNSTAFFLWVTALYYDPSIFEMDRSLFEPLQHEVHADCYGSLLLARMLGLDIFTNCVSNGEKVLSECLSRFPKVKLGTDRNIDVVNFRTHWHIQVHKFVIFLSFDNYFAHL